MELPNHVRSIIFKTTRIQHSRKEITIRHNAPQSLREYVIQTIESLGYGPAFSREIVCRVLRKVPDRNNWTAYPNIYNEVVDLVAQCEWYYVYDIIEGFYKNLKDNHKMTFENEINDYFILNGIGWKIINGIIEIRGDENFEIELSSAVTTLEDSDYNTAKQKSKKLLMIYQGVLKLM